MTPKPAFQSSCLRTCVDFYETRSRSISCRKTHVLNTHSTISTHYTIQHGHNTTTGLIGAPSVYCTVRYGSDPGPNRHLHDATRRPPGGHRLHGTTFHALGIAHIDDYNRPRLRFPRPHRSIGLTSVVRRSPDSTQRNRNRRSSHRNCARFYD